MEDFLQQLPRNLFLYIGAGIFALIMTYRFFPKVYWIIKSKLTKKAHMP